MEIYVATQPVFNKQMNVFGYEILHRSSEENKYTDENPDAASSDVLMHAFDTFGLENLTDGKPAFVHFTNQILENDSATLFPISEIMVQITEDVIPTEKTLKHLEILKNNRYFIVFDDYVLRLENRALLDFASVIRVNLKHADINLINDVKKNHRRIRFMAEKVETQSEFGIAKDLGFDLFQGYFFAKPAMHKNTTMSPLASNCIRLIQLVFEREIDIDEVAKVIESDVALSYKLLRIVNSVEFSFVSEIKSIRHGVVALGTERLKKLVSILSLTNINKDKPDELIKLTLIRAKMLESVSQIFEHNFDSNHLFLVGLFSTLDAIMDKPLDVALSEIKLPKEVSDALIHTEGPYYAMLKIVKMYEGMMIGQLDRTCKELGIDTKDVTKAYMNALNWYKQMSTHVM
jgi:EAL and modified HD-GYP domain-containing signal transduction protein